MRAAPGNTTPNRERVARRRATLRAEGLRPRQFWLPDVRVPAVKAAVEREARSIAAADEQDDIMAFIEAVQYWPED